MSKGAILVDLDHTLATYKSGYTTGAKIGSPIMPMVVRVKDWLRAGYEVRIFTARWENEEGRGALKAAVDEWLAKLDIPPLVVTNVKTYDVVEIWDDRAVRVEQDTGRRIL